MATAVTTDGTPQAPPGKKLCPHTCSCIVKYSSKERFVKKQDHFIEALNAKKI